MCISFCHKRRVVYDNHTDCESDICPFANTTHSGSCHSCQNRRNQICSLTNSPLPAAGGCCHWNIIFVEEKVVITPTMVAPLPMVGFFDRVKHILPADVPYEQQSTGTWLIPCDFASLLSGLGIDYQYTDEGLIVDPEQLLLAIYEPVGQILDRFNIPYHQQSTGEGTPTMLLLDPGELNLPDIFGHSTGDTCL